VRSFRDQNEIAVDLGEVFEVVLDGNFTTGYRWELPQPPQGISLLSDEMRGREDTPGSTGTQHFKLAAESGGRYSLEFSYRRPWEKTTAAERKIDVEVAQD
jgi:predicted secreted protein